MQCVGAGRGSVSPFDCKHLGPWTVAEGRWSASVLTAVKAGPSQPALLTLRRCQHRNNHQLTGIPKLAIANTNRDLSSVSCIHRRGSAATAASCLARIVKIGLLKAEGDLHRREVGAGKLLDASLSPG